MKHIQLTLFFGLIACYSYGQAIIPFADLSNQNRAVSGHYSSGSSKSEYSLYPVNYRNALIVIDEEIQEIDQGLESEIGGTNRESLKRKKSELLSRRELLLEEAGLLDDLNEFY